MTREMSDLAIALGGATILFVVLPSLIMRWVLRLKRAAGLTAEEEALLEHVRALGGTLGDRLASVETILEAGDPDWRAQVGNVPAERRSSRSPSHSSTASTSREGGPSLPGPSLHEG